MEIMAKVREMLIAAMTDISEKTAITLEDLKTINYITDAIKDIDYITDSVKPISRAAHENATEFETAARSADIDNLISVIDEHMTAVNALYPREYAAVMHKLTGKN